MYLIYRGKQFTNILKMTKREAKLEKQKEYMKKRADEYPGYSVYYIPEEHYVGQSKHVYSRIIKDRHLGKIV